jgi:hypothetical protein
MIIFDPKKKEEEKKLERACVNRHGNLAAQKHLHAARICGGLRVLLKSFNFYQVQMMVELECQNVRTKLQN